MYSSNIPPISPQMTQPYPNTGTSVNAEYQPIAMNGLSKMLGPLAAGNGDIDSLNEARNNQYYMDLQKHRQDLVDYGDKQLRYLDQQRRYQQAMLDQRAGAAVRN
ncbi:unnamed protein product [Gongylonema pulchrum]|uniref:Uncharacterized protein n=1 Tax=Gongylonema pulchrum TaxID=637853 RepID=A0A183D021_9BILA|nr:unnamed protein product [Gongylonema pulchrum]